MVHFLDLPPEIRNQIYEDLLKIPAGSFTCWPQILGTCKKVQKEGAGILNANTITINIYSDRIEAHGKPCGSHVPCGVYNPKRNNITTSKLKSIKWPEILNRVWAIYIKVPNSKWYYDKGRNYLAVSPLHRQAIINNVLYSLCSALSSKNCCRALSLQNLRPRETSVVEARTTYYPLLLLGRQSVTIKHVDCNGSEMELDLRDERASRHLFALQYISKNPKSALIYDMGRCVDKIMRDHAEIAPNCIARWNDKIFGALIRTVMFLAIFGVRKERRLDKKLKFATSVLREVAGSLHLRKDNTELYDEVTQLLMLEIELRTVQEVSGR